MSPVDKYFPLLKFCGNTKFSTMAKVHAAQKGNLGRKQAYLHVSPYSTCCVTVTVFVLTQPVPIVSLSTGCSYTRAFAAVS